MDPGGKNEDPSPFRGDQGKIEIKMGSRPDALAYNESVNKTCTTSGLLSTPIIMNESKSAIKCPFGATCPIVHNECRIFQPRKVNIKASKAEDINIYSCNVRSINNKKKSIGSILKNNDIDICILSELSTQNMPKYKGFQNFNCLKNRRNHGITMMVKNHLKDHVVRIPEEELEIIHLRFENITPALHIIGIYLDVEANSTVDEIRKTWNKFKYKIDFILKKGESIITVGDFNRPINNPKMTCGKKLLIDWIKEDTMTLLNNSQATWVDPRSKKESILDLALVSKNIQQFVKSFKVDSNKAITPCSIKGIFSDHKAIMIELKMPVTQKEKRHRKEEIINFKNTEGWEKYPEITDKYAEKIEEILNSCENMDTFENKLREIEKDIQQESFGTIWIDSYKKKKRKRKLEEKIEEAASQYEKIENMMDKGVFKKDLNQKMFKLKEIVTGPKIKAQEPMAINDPQTNELITDKNRIKETYLEHNVKILTKKKPEKDHELEIKNKKDVHNVIMSEKVENVWELDKLIFKKVTDKIKKKGKQLYLLIQ